MIELSKLKILTLDYYIWGQVKYAQRVIFSKVITLHKSKKNKDKRKNDNKNRLRVKLRGK